VQTTFALDARRRVGAEIHPKTPSFGARRAIFTLRLPTARTMRTNPTGAPASSASQICI